MNKATSFTVRASADSMEGFAYFSLILGMARDMAKLSSAVGELAFRAISAYPGLLEGSTELCFVEILRCFFFEGGITVYGFKWGDHLGNLRYHFFRLALILGESYVLAIPPLIRRDLNKIVREGLLGDFRLGEL